MLLSERYRQERAAGHDVDGGARRTYRSTGAAVLASGVTAVAGFAVLVLSDIRMLRDFGLVTVVDLTVSLLGVMVVLPAVLVLAERGELLALPAGAARRACGRAAPPRRRAPRRERARPARLRPRASRSGARRAAAPAPAGSAGASGAAEAAAAARGAGADARQAAGASALRLVRRACVVVLVARLRHGSTSCAPTGRARAACRAGARLPPFAAPLALG